MLPIILQEMQIDRLFIDLEKQVVTTSNGSISYPFEVGELRKYRLLNGLDDIGLTLRQTDKIREFEDRNQPI